MSGVDSRRNGSEDDTGAIVPHGPLSALQKCWDGRLHPATSDRSRGWLRYLRRKATTPDNRDKDGRPHAHWDDVTGEPMTSWTRFDLVRSSYAIPLMADRTRRGTKSTAVSWTSSSCAIPATGRPRTGLIKSATTVCHRAGLHVVFHSNDHRPAHVHVMGDGKEAVFTPHCPQGPSKLRNSYRFRLREVNRIKIQLDRVLP